MPRRIEHDWDLTPKEAVALQRDLQARVRIPRSATPPVIKTIAGGDCSYSTATKAGYAGWVMYRYPEMEEIQRAGRRTAVDFPYVPGLLSFREAPLLLAALNKLDRLPDLLVIDGHGIAHPRRFGIACHLGLLVDRPTIGCAKSRLIGTHGMPAQPPGSTTPLIHKEETIGAVMRSRKGCKPVFISPGHRISLAGAVTVMKACLDGYRVPRPTRDADHFVGELKRRMST